MELRQRGGAQRLPASIQIAQIATATIAPMELLGLMGFMYFPMEGWRDFMFRFLSWLRLGCWLTCHGSSGDRPR